MLALFLFIIFGVVFGYFATLNTSLVSVHFGSYILQNVPLYLLVLASLGVGVLFTTLFYFLKSLSGRFAMGRKVGELAKARKEIADLNKTVHKLELENTRLKAKTGEEAEDEESL
ncbi:hypothetical protein A2Z00_01515 [Candidatus Gottesmanbacteria bacterium RBG_13_45_10]|uniref:Lipopolysaccharide assembly protein A domain-containing protein n=1 Tax=Candidatus Gottesmanbacteria bacterium RBG_13_45_10 TaxID=1798370 RepID=A0A1F5ZH47_9BACT|nr:MAG: hypothetical protein A2Z00_01515 [Candidatus Gottesmanbacteria bacterium RBG_13_45_10]